MKRLIYSLFLVIFNFQIATAQVENLKDDESFIDEQDFISEELFWVYLQLALKADQDRGFSFSSNSDFLPNPLRGIYIPIDTENVKVCQELYFAHGMSGDDLAAAMTPEAIFAGPPSRPDRLTPLQWSPEFDCDDFANLYCRTHERPTDCFIQVILTQGFGHAINLVRKRLPNGDWEFCFVEPQDGITPSCKGTQACWTQPGNQDHPERAPSPVIPDSVWPTLQCFYETWGWEFEKWKRTCYNRPGQSPLPPRDAGEPEWAKCGRPDIVRYYCDELNSLGLSCANYYPSCTPFNLRREDANCNNNGQTLVCADNRTKPPTLVPVVCRDNRWRRVSDPLPACRSQEVQGEACTEDSSRACLDETGNQILLRCCRSTGHWCSDRDPWPSNCSGIEGQECSGVIPSQTCYDTNSNTTVILECRGGRYQRRNP